MAYKFVKELSREEAMRKLKVIERELSVEESFLNALQELLRRRAEGEDLLKEEAIRQYEEVCALFPDIDISKYRRGVLEFFASERKKEISQLLPDRIRRRLSLCSSPPYLYFEGRYAQMMCYSSKKKGPYAIMHRRKEEVLKLFPVAYLYCLIINQEVER